jgi:hypothetical protein
LGHQTKAPYSMKGLITLVYSQCTILGLRPHFLPHVRLTTAKVVFQTISVQTSNLAMWLFVYVCVCVCVLSLKGRWDFFPCRPPNKNLILLLLSFYHFLYLAFNNILYFSGFICSFDFLIITFSFSFSSVLSVFKFRCSLFVNLSFS